MRLPAPSANHSQIQADFNDLKDQIQQIIATSSSHCIIIAGDLNANCHTNPVSNARLKELERYGLNYAVNEPTFYRDSTKLILNVIQMSDSLRNDQSPVTCSVEVCDYASHHRYVCVEITVPRVRQKACRTERAGSGEISTAVCFWQTSGALHVTLW